MLPQPGTSSSGAKRVKNPHFLGTSTFLQCPDQSPRLRAGQRLLCVTSAVLIATIKIYSKEIKWFFSPSRGTEGTGVMEIFHAGSQLRGRTQERATFGRRWELTRPNSLLHIRGARSARRALLREGRNLIEPLASAARKRSLPLERRGAGTGKANNTPPLPGLPSVKKCGQLI